MAEIIASEPDADDFSIVNASYLAHASYAAYGGADDWRSKLQLSDSVREFTCGQFHGFLAAQDRVGIVAFRGSHTVGNFLTDAETPLIRHAAYPGLVHYGFAVAADELWPIIRALLTTFPSTMPLWVTGHSLGGAIATLVSVRLASEGHPVRAVYTYGSPRPGDRHFRDAYELPNFRFVHDNDLVPHLPFRWCYKHVGDLKLLRADGTLLEEDRDWKNKKRELKRHAKLVQRAHRDEPDPPENSLKLTEFDWLADHSLDGYLRAIAKNLPRVPWRIPGNFAVKAPPDKPVRSVDEPRTGPVARPHFLDRPARRKPSISETDLAEAFFKQPPGPNRQEL
jgi:triacylglycerol lipase